jgi:hypothetical protein
MKIKITLVWIALSISILNNAFSQSPMNKIFGVVKDEKGDPLPFATVALGSGSGTETDLDGSFYLEIPADEESMELTASYLGHTPQTTLWTKDQQEKPVKFKLIAGIEMKAVVVVFERPKIEWDYTNCGYSLTSKWVAFPPIKIELTNFKKLSVYPNPFISYVNVEIEVPTPDTYLFHLYNESGQLVFAQATEMEAGLQTAQLDLVQRHLPEGAYFLRISDKAGEIRTSKLMKISPN